MIIAFFYHSLVSDWNNGNAHFLRGIVNELQRRGHVARVFEPKDGWSLSNLKIEYGEKAVGEFEKIYPNLKSFTYKIEELELDRILEAVDLVIVHEWNDPLLVKMVGEHRRRSKGYKLLFHDTHHRLATLPESECFRYLSGFDGVLAYGEALRHVYLSLGLAQSVWTWHEAADTHIFHPMGGQGSEGDLVWIGNWGDEERTSEYAEYLLEPVKALGLRGRAHGVRYPEEGIRSLADAGIEYAGWLSNFRVPEVYSRFTLTLHIPRRPYLDLLPGIPTIRPFEALACGIPLVCSSWTDTEGLFREGEDFLVARNGEEMKRHIRSILNDRDLAGELSSNGLRTILERHTCRHRVDELMGICEEMGIETRLDSGAQVSRPASFRRNMI